MCSGELPHAWRSLVRKDRPDARGDRHVTVRAHNVVGDWMSRRQSGGPERPVVLARRGRSQSPRSTATMGIREKRGKQSRAEGRWAGRWIQNGPETGTESTDSARKGWTRCRSPHRYAGRSLGLDWPYGVGAGNGVKEGRWPVLKDRCGPTLLRFSWVARFHTTHLSARHSRCRNHRLESRMRENRTYGSEGGEGTPFPTPIVDIYERGPL